MNTPTPHIRRALDIHFQTFLPQLNFDWEKDVAWPNIEFEPIADRMYLRPSLLLNPTATVSCGPDGFERIDGIYQISVFDIVNKGIARAEECAAKLVDRFRSGTVVDFGCGHVLITSAYYGSAVPEQTRLHIPVSALFFAYVQKG